MVFQNLEQFCEQIGRRSYPHVGLIEFRARVKNWTITLDSRQSSGEFTELPIVLQVTRLRAPFVPKDLFEFEITPNSLYMKVLNLLRDVEFPYIEVSHHLMIEGNDELKLRQFCANPRLLHLMKSLPARTISDTLIMVFPYPLISRFPGFRETHPTWNSWDTFQLRRRPPGLPEGVSEICFQTGQWKRNVDYDKYLPTLLALFGEILIQLVAIGSASEEAPNVVL